MLTKRTDIYSIRRDAGIYSGNLNAKSDRLLGASIVGACLGFLIFNFTPASIYMGDCGSLYLGFVLSCLAMMIVSGDHPAATNFHIAPVAMMAVPIFDTTLVTIERLAHKRMPWHGGRDHTSHRLTKLLGNREKLAVLALYAIGIACGEAGNIVTSVGPIAGFIILLLLLIAMILFFRMLAAVECYRHSQDPDGSHMETRYKK